HDENVDWNRLPPIVLIYHSSSQPLNIAYVARACDVATKVVVVPFSKGKTRKPLFEMKLVFHDYLPVTRTAEFSRGRSVERQETPPNQHRGRRRLRRLAAATRAAGIS